MITNSSILFLFGNDEYAISRRLHQLSEIFADPTSASMNTARLEARNMSEDDLNNAINAMPFLAERRLVLLANPSARYTTPATQKRFLEFLEKVPPTTLLVIYETLEPKESEKHWLLKWAQKHPALIQTQAFMLPRPKEMTAWILTETKHQGGSMEPSAAARLSEMVGTDTRQAAQEIAKVLAYVNWARPVRVEDVETVTILTAQQSVFDFVDALAQGNGKRAQALLHRLLESEDWFSLWGMVIRQFRLLLLAREVMDGGGSLQDAKEAIHESPYSVEKAYQQATRFTMPVLEAIYHRLLELDEGVKTSRYTLDLAMEILTAQIG
ncbi:MAG: DNA polymerase III subunit delta [Anaerolineae bacterium]